MTHYVKEQVWNRASIAVSVVLAFAVLLAAYLGVRAFVERLRVQERERVTRAVTATATALLMKNAALWSHEIDSLRRAVAERDTVIVDRIRRVVSVDTLTLTDTVVVRESLQQCASLAQDCAAYRVTAAAALAIADSQHVADSTRVVAIATVSAANTVAVRDSLRSAERRVSRRPTWRALGSSAVGALGAGAVLGRFAGR